MKSSNKVPYFLRSAAVSLTKVHKLKAAEPFHVMVRDICEVWQNSVLVNIEQNRRWVAFLNIFPRRANDKV